MLNDKVIRTAFLISFAGHCLLLGMPGVNSYSPQTTKPEEISVRIEIEKPLLLPKVDVMGEEKKLKEIVEEPKQSEPEPKPKLRTEEVIVEEPLKEAFREKVKVIDPVQEAMFRYQDMVKQRIEEARRYPSWTKRQGIEGVACLTFIVVSHGLSQDIKIIRSSGSRILDEEAAATIKRANPFPPIPQELNQDFVSMEVSIVFILQ